jgi:NADH pyrophosphatase NudC (nudix superfamily)
MSSSDYRRVHYDSELLPGQHITVIDETTVIDEHTGKQNRYCGRCGNPVEKKNYTLMCRECRSADADKYGNRPDLKVPKKPFKGLKTSSN